MSNVSQGAFGNQALPREPLELSALTRKELKEQLALFKLVESRSYEELVVMSENLGIDRSGQPRGGLPRHRGWLLSEVFKAHGIDSDIRSKLSRATPMEEHQAIDERVALAEQVAEQWETFLSQLPAANREQYGRIRNHVWRRRVLTAHAERAQKAREEACAQWKAEEELRRERRRAAARANGAMGGRPSGFERYFDALIADLKADAWTTEEALLGLYVVKYRVHMHVETYSPRERKSSWEDHLLLIKRLVENVDGDRQLAALCIAVLFEEMIDGAPMAHGYGWVKWGHLEYQLAKLEHLAKPRGALPRAIVRRDKGQLHILGLDDLR